MMHSTLKIKTLFIWVFTSFLLAVTLSACGGGGGNPGACLGSAEVCGRGSAAAPAPSPGATIGCASSVITAGQYCLAYSVTGSTDQAALTYTVQGSTLQGTVTVPWSKEFIITTETFLYISAQNQRSTGNVATAITVNGAQLAFGQSSEAFGIATASTGWPLSKTSTTATPSTPAINNFTVDPAKVSAIKCENTTSLAEALSYLKAGAQQLDSDKDGKPCEDKYPGQ